jgi:hypothetical protein
MAGPIADNKNPRCQLHRGSASFTESPSLGLSAFSILGAIRRNRRAKASSLIGDRGKNMYNPAKPTRLGHRRDPAHHCETDGGEDRALGTRTGPID